MPYQLGNSFTVGKLIRSLESEEEHNNMFPSEGSSFSNPSPCTPVFALYDADDVLKSKLKTAVLDGLPKELRRTQKRGDR